MARKPTTVRMNDRERRLVEIGADLSSRSKAGFIRQAVREKAIEALQAEEQDEAVGRQSRKAG